MMLPSLKLLEKITTYSKQKGGGNYCLFLLGSKVGLRVSEAVSFDYKVQKEGFFLVRGKGKPRSAYVSPTVISELKTHNWQPNSISRFGFYKFLQKTKKDLGISADTELTPHTLRRIFTTYYAENGVPLPVLSKALGHSSVRTTALYWKSDKEISDELVRELLELDFEKKPTITKEQRRKITNHNYYLRNQERLKKERKNKYQNQKNSLNNLNQKESLSLVKENERLKEENQELQKRIKEFEKLITKQQKEEKTKAEIELYKPQKTYG